MYMLVVVSVLDVLHDSSTIRVEVFFHAVLDVSPDGVTTAAKLPCYIHAKYLRHLHFATGALGNLLTPFRYHDRD